MDIFLQELLQQMLHVKPGSPAPQTPTSPSSTVSSRALTAARPAPVPSHPAQPKHSAAAAPKHAPISKQSSSQSAGAHSVLPFERQGAEPARRGVSPPFSSRSELAASAKETDFAGEQAVSLVAKPELYSALTAAVSAVVQQAGLAQCRPAKDCLTGISLQYCAEGPGAEREEQGHQLEGQGAQLEGQRDQLQGQRAQLEGRQQQSGMQQSCSEGQADGHEGQEAWHEGRQQDLLPSNLAAYARLSGTSAPTSMASQSSAGQALLGQVSTQHSSMDDGQIRAQHAQRSAVDANGAQPTSGQPVTGGEGQGRVAVGQGGLDEGSGRVQAWQAQVEQAMQVLQAALQSSSKAGEVPALVTTR